jgi:hypothetical protein
MAETDREVIQVGEQTDRAISQIVMSKYSVQSIFHYKIVVLMFRCDDVRLRDRNIIEPHVL